MNKALSLAALVASAPFHRAVEYQESIRVIGQYKVPGKGTYEVFTDRYDHCHVDFEADPLAFQHLFSPLLVTRLSSPPTGDPVLKQELLEKYCPDGYTRTMKLRPVIRDDRLCAEIRPINVSCPRS